jgi:hypothetical protein
VARADSLTLAPTRDPKVFVGPEGRRFTPPPDWACLPPGDAGLTRRVKAAGPSWMVIEKKGRKLFSRGLWAPSANIDSARTALSAERSTEAYAKKLEGSRARRADEQRDYVVSFEGEVRSFLRFAPRFSELESAMARAITLHATPVGSGTVARTKRISVERRAEAAVIAWLRHQTTAYDHMNVPRIKGARRRIRRELAQISRALLDVHRRDAAHAERSCPLCAQRTPPELP